MQTFKYTPFHHTYTSSHNIHSYHLIISIHIISSYPFMHWYIHTHAHTDLKSYASFVFLSPVTLPFCLQPLLLSLSVSPNQTQVPWITSAPLPPTWLSYFVFHLSLSLINHLFVSQLISTLSLITCIASFSVSFPILSWNPQQRTGTTSFTSSTRHWSLTMKARQNTWHWIIYCICLCRSSAN